MHLAFLPQAFEVIVCICVGSQKKNVLDSSSGLENMFASEDRFPHSMGGGLTSFLEQQFSEADNGR